MEFWPGSSKMLSTIGPLSPGYGLRRIRSTGLMMWSPSGSADATMLFVIWKARSSLSTWYERRATIGSSRYSISGTAAEWAGGVVEDEPPLGS